MAKSKESFQRREREKAKKAKAEEKRQRRFNREEPEESDEPEPEREPVDEQAVISQLAELNAAYDAGDVPFEDFEKQRAALLESLTIE